MVRKRSAISCLGMRSVSPRRWALVVLSAFLQALPFAIAGPVPAWRRAFCWVALTPLLIALLDGSEKENTSRQSVLLGYVCGVLWYIANCYWIYQTMYLYGGLDKPVALAILFLFSLYLGLYHALFAWLISLVQRRSGTLAALLSAPFLWVAVELARARITGFPWDLLGYAQVDNAALLTLAPVGGVMLLSFITAAVGALFSAAWIDAPRRKAWGTGAFVALIVLQAGTFYRPAPDAAPYAATLLQQNLVPGVMGKREEPLSPDQKYRSFRDLSLSPKTLAGDTTKSSLIVWPESPADFFTHDPQFREQLGMTARAAQIPVITGSAGVDFDSGPNPAHHVYGSAAVFDAQGNYVGRYDKVHRVPWGEYVPFKELFFFAGKLTDAVGNMEAGTKHTVFPLGGHQVGIFICYESIFGDEVREFVNGGADLLVNISDDGWYGDTGAPWQHLDMERMRAVENRRWILRDTNTGITTSVDPHGRGDFSTPRHVREAFRFHFNYLDGTTFYTRHGDWFAWLCAVVSAMVLLLGARLRQRVN